MSDKILVIYHGNCADGFTSAWIARKRFSQMDDVTVDYHAGVYGDPPPDAGQYHQVYILDFSYKHPVLVEWAQKFNAVPICIIDHHKTAQEDLVDLPANVETHFNMQESGASLTWDFFFPHEPRPDIVELVKDRDLWKFNDPRTRPFAAGLFAQKYEFDNWDKAAEHIDGFVEAGKAIELKHFKDIEELMPKTCTMLHIDGYDVRGYNLPYTMSSDVGNIAAKTEEPFGCCYWIDGADVVFSLRSNDTKEVDVSEIAKKYGGGGHRNAAGFKVSLDVFVEDMLIECNL